MNFHHESFVGMLAVQCISRLDAVTLDQQAPDPTGHRYPIYGWEWRLVKSFSTLKVLRRSEACAVDKVPSRTPSRWEWHEMFLRHGEGCAG